MGMGKTKDKQKKNNSVLRGTRFGCFFTTYVLALEYILAEGLPPTNPLLAHRASMPRLHRCLSGR